MGLFDLVFGESVRTLSQVAPTDGWCTIRGVGRMSLVWPWYEVEDPRPLLDMHGRDCDELPALELCCPRTDSEPGLVVWCDRPESDPGGALAQPGAAWARSVAVAHGGRLEESYPVSIGGMRGYLARFNQGWTTRWRILVPRRDGTVHVLVEVPAAHAGAYWAQVQTMLATWGWNS